MNRRRVVKVLAGACLFTALLTPGTVFGAESSTAESVSVSASVEGAYDDVAISRVTNYVNVRTEANTTSQIVGKIYNNCAAKILETVDGEDGKWYRIQSGTVNGYIKAEYFITGSEAKNIAKEIGTVYVKVSADTLRLREEPSLDSKVLTLLSENDEYVVAGESGDFIQIQVDSSMSGYVHKDYVEQRVEFELAVSVAEEQAKITETERLKSEADAAIARVEQLKTESGQSSGAGQGTSDTGTGSIGTIPANPSEPAGNTDAQNPTGPAGQVNNSESSDTAQNTGSGTSGNTGYGDTSGPGGSSKSGDGSTDTTIGMVGPGGGMPSGNNQNETSTNDSGNTSGGNSSDTELAAATRTALVAYARQFLGNPYVYGGTSLTAGTDCSGFTMRIYEHFGIDTGRSSRDQAAKGREIAIDAVQPGDLLFYASGDYINHVAMYIGGGQVIHASTERTGITISTAYYRTPYKAVTFLD